MGAEKISYAYDLTGAAVPVIMEFPIAADTVIEKGEVVKLSGGFVVAVGDTDQDDPYLGIAAEAHDGSTDPRQTGTKIKVYCSPTAVFKCKPNTVSTADSGNTTTWVDAEVGTVGNDIYNGGWLKIKSTSALTDAINKAIAITDFATSTGTFTGTFTGGVTAGDTAVILPPYGSVGWSLNSDGTNLDLKANGGTSAPAIQIVDVDLELEEVYFHLLLHQFANYYAAV